MPQPLCEECSNPATVLIETPQKPGVHAMCFECTIIPQRLATITGSVLRVVASPMPNWDAFVHEAIEEEPYETHPPEDRNDDSLAPTTLEEPVEGVAVVDSDAITDEAIAKGVAVVDSDAITDEAIAAEDDVEVQAASGGGIGKS